MLTPEAEVTVQSTRPPYPIVVEPGQQKTITADLSNASITLEPGTAYTVKVTTQAGNTYVAVVFCK